MWTELDGVGVGWAAEGLAGGQFLALLKLSRALTRDRVPLRKHLNSVWKYFETD
jgi:hypothetical protein